MDTDPYLAGVRSDLYRPHVILPAQHFNRPAKLTPELRLMIGVLDDAVDCIRKHRFDAGARSRRRFDEAMQWLLATEPHWPFSFERICAALDLDAGAVRRRLLRSVPERPAIPRVPQMRMPTRERRSV